MKEENKNIIQSENQIAVFKTENGALEFEVSVDFEKDTVWLNRQHLSLLFGKDIKTIGKHINNIFVENELERNSTVANFATVQMEGDREVVRQMEYYNLDVIISVGYRVKSKQGNKFRKWASAKLKEYLIQGYSLNTKRLEENNSRIQSLQQQVLGLQNKLIATENQLTDGFLTIINQYSKSFNLLNKYDSEKLLTEELNEEIIYVLDYKGVKSAIEELKKELIKKDEASELFGNEKDKSFEGILGSISQTIFGNLAYPSVEEQAAQLLYSIIKGHAFSDGNKRIGSFIFVWFLEQNNFHLYENGQRKITQNTLVALALMVAQSNPNQRELLIKLIINLIK